MMPDPRLIIIRLQIWQIIIL